MKIRLSTPYPEVSLETKEIALFWEQNKPLSECKANSLDFDFSLLNPAAFIFL